MQASTRSMGSSGGNEGRGRPCLFYLASCHPFGTWAALCLTRRVSCDRKVFAVGELFKSTLESIDHLREPVCQNLGVLEFPPVSRSLMPSAPSLHLSSTVEQQGATTFLSRSWRDGLALQLRQSLSRNKYRRSLAK